MNERDLSNATILVTGGAGFIGSNFVYHINNIYPKATIVNLDKLTYAGNLENLLGIKDKPNYRFVHGDIGSRNDVEAVFNKFNIDHVVNFAAESHVDRSIHDASPFITTNVGGTVNLMETAHAKWTGNKDGNIFVHVSTDEVYGSLGPTGKFTEETPLAPQNPYSSSKAAADMMVSAYVNTHDFPAIITRCSNNYGPYQFPEKLIPLTIINIMNNKKIPVYGDGKNVRDWIFVADHCDGIEAAMRRGNIGEIYNLGGETELPNIELVTELCRSCGDAKVCDSPKELITFVTDRPGHDRRYAMDIAKARRELGWRPKHDMKNALKETVNWYIANKEWWAKLLGRDYDEYYTKQYGKL